MLNRQILAQLEIRCLERKTNGNYFGPSDRDFNNRIDRNNYCERKG